MHSQFGIRVGASGISTTAITPHRQKAKQHIRQTQHREYNVPGILIGNVLGRCLECVRQL